MLDKRFIYGKNNNILYNYDMNFYHKMPINVRT